MVFQGSKNRMKKDILPFIEHFRKLRNSSTYIEPFVGGANVIDSVSGFENVIGYDINKYLIGLLNYVKKNELVITSFNKETYQNVKSRLELENIAQLEDWFIGLVGYVGGFRAKFFSGSYSESPKGRNYIEERIRNIKKQSVKFKDINFICKNYKEIEIPINSVVYCDPPYQGTTKYDKTDDFNSLEFWDWVREISKYSTVLVSEYSAPEDFLELFSKEVENGLSLVKKDKAIEKIFILKD